MGIFDFVRFSATVTFYLAALHFDLALTAADERVDHPDPSVVQRVVLHEYPDYPNVSEDKRYIGTVVWRTEMVPSALGHGLELAVLADIEVPDRKMKVTWSLRQNSDPLLPASHTIDILINLPADSPSGGVQSVPGVLMKQAEETPGEPFYGMVVGVTPGFFLIGLSTLESQKQHNIQLLKERSWIDILVVYNNNRRAILTMEKGAPGEKAFNNAFGAWKQ